MTDDVIFRPELPYSKGVMNESKFEFKHNNMFQKCTYQIPESMLKGEFL